jgi:hypothetical protein
MNNEDAPRGAPYQGRRPYPSKFQDNRAGSGENRYNQGENRYGQNSNYSSFGYNKGTNPSYSAGQQHAHKKIDRFHREPVNYSEKLVKQNDLIIKLLKEIRDRLPAPPVSETPEAESGAMNQNARTDEPESMAAPQNEIAAVTPEDAADQDEVGDSPGNSL